MLQVRQRFIWALAIAGALLMAFLYWGEARAHHYHDHDINIDIDIDNGGGDPGTNNCMTCVPSARIDDEAFASALTQAYASGAHELDWSTTDIQISVTYALQFDGEEEDAYSFKVGKKELFGDKFLSQGMFHLTLNPEVENLGNTAVFGATFRIP